VEAASGRRRRWLPLAIYLVVSVGLGLIALAFVTAMKA
jgi:hypothetical protein